MVNHREVSGTKSEFIFDAILDLEKGVEAEVPFKIGVVKNVPCLPYREIPKKR